MVVRFLRVLAIRKFISFSIGEKILQVDEKFQILIPLLDQLKDRGTQLSVSCPYLPLFIFVSMTTVKGLVTVAKIFLWKEKEFFAMFISLYAL